MGFIARLIGRRDETALPLYNAIVTRAREPHWYEAGVPDTVDGRFDMIATALSFVLLRLEDEPAAAEASARLTERFIDDMDGQLRDLGSGDIVGGGRGGGGGGGRGGRRGAGRAARAGGGRGPGLV